MAATYVALNGSAENDAGATTLTFTTTRTINAGERVVVMGGCNDSNTVTSAQVGSLNLVEDVTTPSGHCSIFSAVAEEEIASGATVTITYNGSAQYRTGACLSLADAAGSVGDTSSGSGFDAAPASGAADTTDGCVAVAAVSLDITTSVGPSGSYAEVWESGRTFADTQVQYDEIPSAGTTNAGWTLGGTQTWEAIVAIYPEQAYTPPEPQQTILFPHRMGG